MHDAPHPLAGQTVRIKQYDGPAGVELSGRAYEIEDYYDRVTGRSWMDATGNPGAMKYAIRSAVARLPLDDEVLYGNVGAISHLVHVSEVEPVPAAVACEGSSMPAGDQ